VLVTASQITKRAAAYVRNSRVWLVVVHQPPGRKRRAVREAVRKGVEQVVL